MRTEIILSGDGGQGLLLAGVFLGEAIAIYEGKNATQNQSYGVQARGGECKSEVIVSDEEINYAEVEQPDILLAMSQSALNAYGPSIKEGGIVIVDSGLVKDLSIIKNTKNVFQFSITNISLETTQKAILANVVALGVMSALTGIVSKKSLEKEIKRRAPAGMEELNLKALAGGFDAVKSAKAQ